MADHFLGDRRRALEDAFFAQQEAALRQRWRQAGRVETRRRAIAEATGITDAATIEKIAGLDLGADSLTALYMVPLVAMAWADGSIDAGERAAVLAEAARIGWEHGSAGEELLHKWLAHKPAPALLDTWEAYVRGLAAKLDQAGRAALKADLLQRARAIAEAGGGVLGLVERVSPAEAAMLHRFESVFG